MYLLKSFTCNDLDGQVADDGTTVGGVFGQT